MFRALLEEDSQRSKKTRDAQRPITALCHIFEYVTQGSYKAPRGMGVPPMKHGQDARATPAHCPLVVKPQRHRGTEVFGWAWFVFFYPQINRLRRFFGALLGFWNHRAHREHRVLGEGHGSVVSCEGAKARRLEGESPREPASAQVPSRSTGRASARPRASRRLPDPASQA